MMLTTSYALPYRVRYQHELASGEHDITVRAVLDEPAATETAETLDATVLPFLLLATSGAMAGESIAPWTSTIQAWSKPVVRGHAVEWSLTGAICDLQAWSMLAQMWLPDHLEHPIKLVEFFDSRRPYEMVDAITGQSRVNPYPSRWSGVGFPVEFFRDLPRNFTVGAAFSHILSAAEKEHINEDLSAWASGLMIGAYGVAPVPPDRCTAYPDEEVVFVDHALEWAISNFKAHSGAIEGLINILASISHRIVRVTGFRVE